MNVAGDVVLSEEEQKRRKRARSVALAVALGLLVALFYVLTIAKLGSNIMNRPL